MDVDRPSDGGNTTMLHDVFNQLVSNVFESIAAREQLREAFPSSAVATDDAAAKRALANFTSAVQHNLSATIDSWIADTKLATHLDAVKTTSCFHATMTNDENSASTVNAPRVNRPAQAIVQLTETFKRQHLGQLASALAAREGRLEQLRSQLRQQIDEASALCKQLDTLSANSTSPMQ